MQSKGVARAKKKFKLPPIRQNNRGTHISVSLSPSFSTPSLHTCFSLSVTHSSVSIAFGLCTQIYEILDYLCLLLVAAAAHGRRAHGRERR
mmetsp:Transcript_456/g.1317  ORF Transcript_456/g.1317 Transcript_456/m.1317 type:complete len:91 (-) Transcript_456:14-286(-)